MDTHEKINDSPAPGPGAVVSVQSRDQITTVDMFDQGRAKGALFVATQIAGSSLIPEHYQQRPENVMMAMYRSARLGVDVFAYMETTYPVNGKLGHEGKFVVALINGSKKFKTPLMYEFTGEVLRNSDGTISDKSTRKCRAFAILKDTDITLSQEVGIDLAFREGWVTKTGVDKVTKKPYPLTAKSNKWQTMPDIMLQYRAGKFFGNMYCPENVMGLNTRDELEDIAEAEVIEQTETGKDIFDKGVEVSTVPDPVIDPANAVVSEVVVVASEPVVTAPPPSMEIKIAPPAVAMEATTNQEKVPPLSAEELKNPPEHADGFRMWFFRYFTDDYEALTVFLLGKKWLAMGEEARDLTDTKLKDLRGMWAKFIPAFEKFKAERKAGRA